jgi:hypothetical protein
MAISKIRTDLWSQTSIGAAVRSATDEKGIGGRPKGSPNKVATEVREVVPMALDEAEGVNDLVGCAKKHPVAFLARVGKVMPTRVEAEVYSGEIPP